MLYNPLSNIKLYKECNPVVFNDYCVSGYEGSPDKVYITMQRFRQELSAGEEDIW